MTTKDIEDRHALLYEEIAKANSLGPQSLVVAEFLHDVIPHVYETAIKDAMVILESAEEKSAIEELKTVTGYEPPCA